MPRVPLALALALTTGCVSKRTYTELQNSHLALGEDYAALQAANAELTADQQQLQARLDRLRGDNPRLSATYERMLDELGPMMRSGDVTVSVEGDRMIIGLGDPVGFDFGQARLDPEARRTIDGIARVLRDLDGMNVEIQGHADAVPVADSAPWEDNTALAAARARAVERSLRAHGVTDTPMAVVSFGDQAPAVPTSGPSEANRRVVVAVEPAPADIDGARAFARAAGERDALVVRNGADLSELRARRLARADSGSAVIVASSEPRPDAPVMLHDFTIPVENGDVVRVSTNAEQELRFSYAGNTMVMRVQYDEVEDELRELYDEVAGWEFNRGVTGAEIDDEVRDLLVEAIDHDTIVLVDGEAIPGDHVDREVGEFWEEVLDAPDEMDLRADEIDDEIEALRDAKDASATYDG